MGTVGAQYRLSIRYPTKGLRSPWKRTVSTSVYHDVLPGCFLFVSGMRTKYMTPTIAYASIYIYLWLESRDATTTTWTTTTAEIPVKAPHVQSCKLGSYAVESTMELGQSTTYTAARPRRSGGLCSTFAPSIYLKHPAAGIVKKWHPNLIYIAPSR